MRKFVLLAAGIAAFFAIASTASATVRTVTGAKIVDKNGKAKANSNVSLDATLNTCTSGPCLDPLAPAIIPELAIHDKITLPKGFKWQGGIRADLTKSASKAPKLAFATCPKDRKDPSKPANKNSNPAVTATGGPVCPSGSEVGSGKANAFVHGCKDGANSNTATNETVGIRIFNGGSKLYGRLTGTPIPIDTVLTVSFNKNVIEFDVEDSAVSPVVGKICSPLVKTILKLNTSHLSAKVKERVHGSVQTVREPLLKSGGCPPSGTKKIWNLLDEVKFTAGDVDPNNASKLKRNVTSTASGKANAPSQSGLACKA
jgi:hypothetical protein